ncbi:hypothetical protein KFK09_001654 [Dendrobium nobile]|uniref:Uncharacterized protein n=1 Tax=Dendrobium nobile TaxID=94219 RepID=A0A8T3C7Z7_DENNO|nr:hypothetical protein KFK09_001654 [Dendrobium nobile]
MQKSHNYAMSNPKCNDHFKIKQSYSDIHSINHSIMQQSYNHTGMVGHKRERNQIFA